MGKPIKNNKNHIKIKGERTYRHHWSNDLPVLAHVLYSLVFSWFWLVRIKKEFDSICFYVLLWAYGHSYWIWTRLINRTINPVNRYLSRSGFIIRSFILLNQTNLIKTNGFCATHATRTGCFHWIGFCNSYENYFYRSMFILFFFWKDVYTFILYKIGQFDHFQLIRNLKELKKWILYYIYNTFPSPYPNFEFRPNQLSFNFRMEF